MNGDFNLYSKDSSGSDPYKNHTPTTRSTSSYSSNKCSNSTASSVAGSIAKGIVTNVIASAITGVPVFGAETAIEVAADIITDNL